MMPVSRSPACKRAIDLVLGSALLALFALPMGVVPLIVCLRLWTPVLFQQQRSGRHGRLFSIYKFGPWLTRQRRRHHPSPTKPA